MCVISLQNIKKEIKKHKIFFFLLISFLFSLCLLKRRRRSKCRRQCTIIGRVWPNKHLILCLIPGKRLIS